MEGGGGGGVRLNFHFDYLNPSLLQYHSYDVILIMLPPVYFLHKLIIIVIILILSLLCSPCVFPAQNSLFSTKDTNFQNQHIFNLIGFYTENLKKSQNVAMVL